MFRHFSRISIVLIVLLVLISTVSADSRINPAPYHIGGDVLFCDSDGCELLNQNGVSLGMWSADAIGGAIADSDASGANSLVGEVAATYGTAQLWVVFIGEDSEEKMLCLIGYDEHGKLNNFCFKREASGAYDSVPLPVSEEVTAGPVADCSPWSAGDSIYKLGTIYYGHILSVNPASGTALIQIEGDSDVGYYSSPNAPEIVSCDALEVD